MKVFIHSITFFALLFVASCLPTTTSNNNQFKKLKLKRQETPFSALQKRSSNFNKLKQTGYSHGSGYYSTVKIGEPAQSFNVVLDTGSSDFWVVSNDCLTKEYCYDHQQFQPLKSKTYKKHDPQKSLQIRYGTGSIGARVGLDTLHIGSMTLKNQFIADAIQISRDFKDLPIDGILGLGLSKLSKTDTKKLSLVQNMVQQGLIERAVFGIYTQPAGGEIDFGGMDSSRYTGEIKYAPVTDDIYWQTIMRKASFGDYTMGSRSVIFDTGSTLLITTPEDAKNIHSQIEGAVANRDGSYYIPCGLKGKMPDLVLTINGHVLSLSSDDYILVSTPEDESMCISGISGQNENRPNHWILGDAFLKSYYTVFDTDNMKIGFAKSVIDPSLSIEQYDKMK